MTTEASARTFFSSAKYYAVVGASSDPAKFGHKVFAWYLNHGLPVTPVNPAGTVNVAGKDHPAVTKLEALPNPTETAVSFITPPGVTRKILQEAKALKISSVWLQPGSADKATIEWAHNEGGFKAVVAGEEGGTRAHDGWCVLVDGERALQAAQKL